MDREQTARDCLVIEKLGMSVLDFLREEGAVSPWGTWHRLQMEELGRSRSQIRDGKGSGRMPKKQIVTPEVEEEALRAMENGEDPKPILIRAGSKNPSAAAYYIRKKNGMIRKPGATEIRMEAGETYRGTPEAERKPEEPEQKPEEPERKPERRGLLIREAEGLVGIWGNRGSGEICFTKNGFSIQMKAEEWLMLAEELPNVMETFGLDENGREK